MDDKHLLTKSDVIGLVREFAQYRQEGGDSFDQHHLDEGLWLYASDDVRVGILVAGEENQWRIAVYSAARVRMRATYELYRYVSRWRTTIKAGAPYVVEEGEWAAVMCETGFRHGQLIGREPSMALIRTTVDTIAQVSEELSQALRNADGTPFTATGAAGAALLLSWWQIFDESI